MYPTEYSAIVQRLRDASSLTAVTGFMLILTASRTEAGEAMFSPQQIIQQSDASGLYSVFAADLDGDGDQDLLSASRFDDKIAWYKNTDGRGTFGRQEVITTAADSPRSVFAADLDGDGDFDVLSASQFDDKIAWYENTDGFGAFGPQQVITSAFNGARSVFAADLDGDGDLDVLSASVYDAKIAWYENTDGFGAFGPQQVITTSADGAQAVFAADLDGDGDFDVLSASWTDNKIAWYENTDGLGGFGPQQAISAMAPGAASVFAADLDGDGDHDVISASAVDNKIAWHENTDGLGKFGSEQVITTAAVGAISVFATDLDGDGDKDAISASGIDDKVAWHENTDGQGVFGPRQVITTLADGALSVFAADLDGDGDKDVLSASHNDNKIAWYENTDGLGAFGPQQVVTTAVNRATSVFVADLDGDGDQDVLSASRNDHKIAWYKNTNGQGAFSTQRVITTSAEYASAVFAADLDRDGDQDVLSASVRDDKIAWYENTDGLGTFGPQRVITASADGATAVFAADLDGDGDQDVLSASWKDDKIAWYENLLPQRPTRTPAPTATSTPIPRSTAIYVDTAATGSNDGTSWNSAFTDLQDALAMAGSGDEIWAAEGVYVPGSNEEDTFHLKNGVAIYGGYERKRGRGGHFRPREFEKFITVLSGDIGRDDTTDGNGVTRTVSGIVGENSLHVVTGSGTDGTAVLDGFTIAGGHANGPSVPEADGGGMYIEEGSPALANLTFIGNRARSCGGGMFNMNSTPRLANVSFESNFSDSFGGGMANICLSSARLDNVTFVSNLANGNGGGMYCDDSSPILTNVTYLMNSARVGGGMYNSLGSNGSLTNVAFLGNIADRNGGGLAIDDISNPLLTNVILSGNSADRGGGISVRSSSSPTLVNITFSGNSTTSRGGGLFVQEDSIPVVSNSIFWGNKSGGFNDQISNNDMAPGTPILNNCLVQGGCPDTHTTCNTVIDADLTCSPKTGPCKMLESLVNQEVRHEDEASPRGADYSDVAGSGAWG